MHHPQVRVAEARVIIHDRRNLRHLTHISRLLTQFAHSSFFGRLASIDKAGGDFDRDLVNRWAVLLLKDDFLAGRFVDDGEDADAVDVSVLGSGASLGRFPCAGYAIGILVCGSR